MRKIYAVEFYLLLYAHISGTDAEKKKSELYGMQLDETTKPQTEVS